MPSSCARLSAVCLALLAATWTGADAALQPYGCGDRDGLDDFHGNGFYMAMKIGPSNPDIVELILSFYFVGGNGYLNNYWAAVGFGSQTMDGTFAIVQSTINSGVGPMAYTLGDHALLGEAITGLSSGQVHSAATSRWPHSATGKSSATWTLDGTDPRVFDFSDTNMTSVDYIFAYGEVGDVNASRRHAFHQAGTLNITWNLDDPKYPEAAPVGVCLPKDYEDYWVWSCAPYALDTCVGNVVYACDGDDTLTTSTYAWDGCEGEATTAQEANHTWCRQGACFAQQLDICGQTVYLTGSECVKVATIPWQGTDDGVYMRLNCIDGVGVSTALYQTESCGNQYDSEWVRYDGCNVTCSAAVPTPGYRRDSAESSGVRAAAAMAFAAGLVAAWV